MNAAEKERIAANEKQLRDAGYGRYVDEVQAKQAGNLDEGLNALLDSIAEFVARYVIFPSKTCIDALALWVLHTWTWQSCETTLYLIITAPQKRSGKSRLLEVLELLVARPFRVIETTEASVFRIVDSEKPTLMLDESDGTFGKDSKLTQGLRAIFNAGHRPGNPVPRVVGEGKNMKVAKFETYCPKVFCGIEGNLPETVRDRGVILRLQRKNRDEEVKRFRIKDAKAESLPLREDIGLWASTAKLTGTCENVPLALNDRAADGWEPLLEIADRAGWNWAQRGRVAATSLHGDDVEEESAAILLLSHLQETFNGHQHMTSKDLLEALVKREDGPWGEWWGKYVNDDKIPPAANRMAKLLRPFGVSPVNVREGGSVHKAYNREPLEDAWKRYLPLSPANCRYTATTGSGEESQAHSPEPQASTHAQSNRSGVAANPGREAVEARNSQIEAIKRGEL